MNTNRKSTSEKLTTKVIIKAFKNNEPEIIEEIYSEYFPLIKHLVEINSGNKNDAKDVFQEALMVIYNKIEKSSFTLNSSFKTFLYSISRNIWFNQLRKRKVFLNDFKDKEDYIVKIDNKSIIKETCLNIEYDLFRQHFEKLSCTQKMLFKLFFENYSFKQIADILNYKNAAYARKEKYNCKNILIESIQNDPKYADLLKMHESIQT